MKFNRRLLSLAFLFVSVFASLAAAQNRERTYDVQHYIIRVSFDRQTKTVFGDTTVRLKPLGANFQNFALDAANLKIQSIMLEESNKPLKFTQTGAKLNVNLGRAYKPEDTISVRVKYQTVKPRAGIYFVDAVIRNGKTIRPAQIWSQGEPEESHHWFPCYDFPDDKATTEQFITTTAADEIAIGNGELVETKPNRNGTKTFHYRMNVPYTTYLVSLVVGKYTKVEDKYGNIPLSFYVYPGTESIVPLAYGKTKKMFAFYEEKLGVKFPYNKYDQTVVGSFQFGGMENITATTMADTEIYAAREELAARGVENLVSHELAHSWFGNLVTTKNWSNLWLNEGFATFFEAAFLEHEYGREAYLKEMQLNAAQYFLEETFVKHPLLNLRAQPNMLLFDATTYKKGGFVVHMLRESVGEEMFWKSLNNYLNKHKFANVETADLQRAFEETTGKNLDWFFDQWVRKAGFPRLEIQPSYDAAAKKLNLIVRQTQKADSITPDVFRLPAEIEIITETGTRTEKIEITEREQTFAFDVPAMPTKVNFDSREQILKKLKIEEIAAATSARLR